jgi:threonyl-tRNA synthetase
VAGDREIERRGVSVRRRDTGDAGFQPLDEFIPWLRGLIDMRAAKW